MIQLETYRGTKSRHTCPACSHQNCFSRYIDENGEHISFDVGRCNRESKCGYHRKPKEYFADNPVAQNRNFTKAKKGSTSNYGFTDKPLAAPAPDYIPFKQFKSTLDNYDRNPFVQFLLGLFWDCIEEIESVLKMYFVGAFEDYTCLPYIDAQGRICRAKLIRFNQATGRRLKGEFDTSSLPAKLKLKEDFNYKQIFFGEHLLTKYPDKPIAIVESEKSAIIAALCFPEFVWLGSGSKQWLKAERLHRLGTRQIVLYPDADGFESWQRVSLDAQRQGSTGKVSRLIEINATTEKKADGYDLADYLISQQKEINDFNDKLQQNVEIILDEQKSILIINGELTESEAERIVTQPDNVRGVVLACSTKI